jgi:hypothetical protein
VLHLHQVCNIHNQSMHTNQNLEKGINIRYLSCLRGTDRKKEHRHYLSWEIFCTF